MVDPEREGPGDADLVFAAHNNHTPSCGRPPGLRSTADPGLYHGYFENCYGEQFVFTFDRAKGAGMVLGGDLGWDEPKSFTLDLVDEALRSTQRLAAQIEEPEAARLPIIDAALALGASPG